PGGLGKAKKLSKSRRIEMYSQGRYFTVTGEHLAGTPLQVEDRSKQVALLFRKLFRGTDSRATGEPDQLPDEEIERRVKAVLQRVSEEVRELWGAVPDQDRSGFEYRLACEAVKAGV